MHVQTYKLSSLTEFYTDPHVDPQSDTSRGFNPPCLESDTMQIAKAV